MRVGREHLVAHVNRLDKALGLEVVESELVAHGGRGLVLKLPSVLIVLRCILVRGLPLHDLPHVLPGLAARLVVLEAPLAELVRQVVLPALYVDVGQQEPRALKLLRLVWLVLYLLDPLELVARLWGLLEHHETCGQREEHRHVVPVRVGDLEKRADRLLDVLLVPGGHEGVALEHLIARRPGGGAADLAEEPLGGVDRAGVVRAALPLVGLVPDRLVVGVEVDLHHLEDGLRAPVGVLASHVELLECKLHVVLVARVQALAEVQAGVHGRPRGRALGGPDELGDVLQPPRAPQKGHELRQRLVVVGDPLQQLLKVVDRGLVVLLVEHELRQHDGGLVVFGVGSEQRDALLLAGVGVPVGHVELGEGEHGLGMLVVGLQGIVVHLHRLLPLPAQLVLLGKLAAHVRGECLLLVDDIGVLPPELAQEGALRRPGLHQLLDEPVVVPAPLEDLGHHLQRFHVHHERLDRVPETLPLQDGAKHPLGSFPLLQLVVELCQLHLQRDVLRVCPHCLDQVVQGALVVVGRHQCLPNLCCQLDVLWVLLQRGLKGADCLLWVLNLHEGLAEHDVGLGVGLELDELHVAPGIGVLVVVVLQVDVGHRDLGPEVVRRVAGDDPEHLERPLDVLPRKRELAVGDGDSHLFGRALEFLKGIVDDLCRLRCVVQTALLGQALRHHEVDRHALVEHRLPDLPLGLGALLG
mmetsp:Transcript_7032/g.16876  ORF Transcript_7032/g.16876 Transcript_7032/m.16876 type:complete len:697 (-) Transcript_7032:517-2607(-)